MEADAGHRDFLIFLVVAGIVVPLFSRLRLSIVLGFLLAGVLLGPGGLGKLVGQAPWLDDFTIADQERVEPFAELGVLFLLFTIGLELSVDRLWAMRRLVFGAGSAQVLVTATVIAAAAMLLGVAGGSAIIIGLALAFSSTAIVLQVLAEEGRLGGPAGEPALGVLLMQDLWVVPAVILVGVLAGDGEGVLAAAVQGFGLAVLVVVVILFAGRIAMPPLLTLAANTRAREIMLAIALLIAVGSAAVSEAAGLSPELGAFLAGLLFGGSAYRHQVEVDIEPFKGLLLGLFFMTVGMSVDVAALIDQIGWVVLAVLALLAAKAAILWLVLRLFGVVRPAAVEVALLLAGGGEFAFVIFGLVRSDSLVGATLLQFLTTVVAVSMVVTPGLGAVARRIATRLERQDGARSAGRDGAAAELTGHVVIGGFGRVGETVGRVLDGLGMPYAAIDLDPDRVNAARRAGRHVAFGDASRPEMLEHVGAARARAFVVTSDSAAETDRTVAAIATAWPGVPIYARAKDAAHAARLRGLGATDSVMEAVEGSLQLAAITLEGLGAPEDTVEDAVDRVRAEQMARLAAASDRAASLPGLGGERADQVDAVGPDAAVEAGRNQLKGVGIVDAG